MIYNLRATKFNDVFSGSLPGLRRQNRTLMMTTEMVLETSVFRYHLTCLIGQETPLNCGNHVILNARQKGIVLFNNLCVIPV